MADFFSGERSISSGGLPAMPSEVLLISTSAFASSAGTSARSCTEQRGPKAAASFSARSRVRLTMETEKPRSRNANTEARAEPPAPSTSAIFSALPGGDPSGGCMSSRLPTMPSQSVLPPTSVSPSYQTVLTAPIASAARSRRSTRRNAASLCGMVMFPPTKPLRFRPRKNASNFSGGTSACS